MKLKSIMSVNVVCVEMEATLSRVKEIFDTAGFHHLLVVERNKLLGVISDRDLLKSISPKVDCVSAVEKDLATLNKRAHQIMSRQPVCLTEDDTIFDAVKVFKENKISCIPIVNENRFAVGIVSWRDIIGVLHDRLERQATQNPIDPE